jgi:tetratricopeptide (TPR) repeat protein
MFGLSRGAGRSGAPATVERRPEDFDLRLRSDRVGKYLKKYLKQFVFDELSPDFLARGKLGFLKDVPVPLREEDLKAFKSGGDLPLTHIGENMAQVIGASPAFPHAGAYAELLRAAFGKKVADFLVKGAKNAGENGDAEGACLRFRAALCLDPKNLAALYGYARACRALYLAGGDSEYVGKLKAEALEFFELTTEFHPRFSMGFYYLGYAYVNIGLYQKAHLAWKRYLEISSHPRDRKEIKERVRQLADPLEIERGYNAVLAGRWDEGRTILEAYRESRYKDWWPLYYYLGAAYISTDRRDEAVSMFKQALRLNPSHAESMDELADIYEIDGEAELSEKYRRKAQLVRDGGHKET